MNLLDMMMDLNKMEAKGVKIILGEVGAGKTTFIKDMPKPALFIPVGNDYGFKMLTEHGFKAVPSVKTFRDEQGRIVKRAIPILCEALESLLKNDMGFKSIAIDAISTLNEIAEAEIKEVTGKRPDWDGWAAIKTSMTRVFDLCEQLAEKGMEVALISHETVRSYTDSYTGETMSSILPAMTESTAKRFIKNADALVYLKVMPDPDDKTKVQRVGIVGGHPIIPTKLRNAHSLSFDNLHFQNLTYGKLLRLMEIDNISKLDDLEYDEFETEMTEDGAKHKSKSKKTKKSSDDDLFE